MSIIASMHIHISAAQKALSALGIPYTNIPGFPHGLVYQGGACITTYTPFNSESGARFCRDKAAVYELLKDIVPVPTTKYFIDPWYESGAQKSPSLEDILTMSSDILYPRIIKMNTGERGQNVFLTHSHDESRLALSYIYDKQSKYYDSVALIQQYITLGTELRVFVVCGEIICVYERLSARGIDRDSNQRIYTLAQKIIPHIPGLWYALDFIESTEGDIYFLEVNTRPFFATYCAVHGEDMLVGAYTKAFRMQLKQ